jgi:hypothetical protein
MRSLFQKVSSIFRIIDTEIGEILSDRYQELRKSVKGNQNLLERKFQTRFNSIYSFGMMVKVILSNCQYLINASST